MKKGFSLIETLILCLIGFSILILIIGVISNSREFARTMGCINNMKNISQAIENYQVDWRETPVTLSSLIPVYIQNVNVLHCPSDREKGDSYSKFYIGRYFAEADSNKIFLLCPRHFRGERIAAAYLSYAVEIVKNKKIQYYETEYSSPQIVKPGEILSRGILKFEDNTKVSLSGKTGVLGSFTNPEGKIYSIIYIPEGEKNSTVNIEHHGDSKFEVITPAVIAGVEGTKFNVINEWTNDTLGNIDKTTISVIEGTVNARERNQGRVETVNSGEKIEIITKTYSDAKTNIVPRKPPKQQPHIIKRKK